MHFSRTTSNAAKGLAVILMLFHHLISCSPEFVEKYGVSTFFISMDRLVELSAAAKICVAIFVFITAYGISLSMKKNETPGTSMKNAVGRWAKLEKNFLVVFVIAIATCFLRPDHLTVYTSNGAGMTPVFFILDALGLANAAGTPSYNETWWYMSLAILLIFLIPVMAIVYRYISVGLLVIVFFLPYLGMQYTGASYYLFTAALGVWMAQSRVLTKIRDRFDSAPKKILLAAALALVLAALVFIRIRIGLAYWTDAFAAAALCILLFIIIDTGRYRFPILSFFGKYSMNVFLIHTLIFEYYFTDFIYSFKNWLLILIVLLVISTAVSVGIEKLKQLLGITPKNYV